MAGLPLTVRRIAGALAGRVPVVRPGGGERAAVALLLHDSAEEEAPRLLLIERARREGDPWSGDLAFPGGRMEPGDAGERAAAERETAEEIAVDLAAARCLGRLDDMEASLLPMTVAAFVYSVESATVPALSLSEEVTEAFWVPLPDLFDRRRLPRAPSAAGDGRAPLSRPRPARPRPPAPVGAQLPVHPLPGRPGGRVPTRDRGPGAPAVTAGPFVDGPLLRARFAGRPNRFLVRCRLDGGQRVTAFLPNPGRMDELLFPEVELTLVPAPAGGARRTRWTCVAVEREGETLFLHTHRTNAVARHLLESGRVPGLRGWRIAASEVAAGHSRFDFLLRRGSRRLWLEVKSCTLFGNGVAMFPDAVTERGRRHLLELAAMPRGHGERPAVMFVVHTRSARWFLPDYHTDLAFSRTLLEVRRQVRILPVAVGWNADLTLREETRLLDIPWGHLRREAVDRGAYLLLLRLARRRRLRVGGLGEITFAAGMAHLRGLGHGQPDGAPRAPPAAAEALPLARGLPARRRHRGGGPAGAVVAPPGVRAGGRRRRPLPRRRRRLRLLRLRLRQPPLRRRRRSPGPARLPRVAAESPHVAPSWTLPRRTGPPGPPSVVYPRRAGGPRHGCAQRGETH